MRFLVDENIGKSIVEYLRGRGDDVIWVKEFRPGMSDAEILKLALKERRVIVTYDQDFGELVFLDKAKHYGVLLIKASTDVVSYHLRAVKNFLNTHSPKEIIGRFFKVGDEFL